MSETEHVKVKVQNSVTPAFVLQALLAIAMLAGLYNKMTNADEKLGAEQLALKADVVRIDADTKSMKSEIRDDLRELRDEVRRLRADLAAPKR